MSFLLGITIIFLSILLVFVGRWISKRDFLKNRGSLSAELIFIQDLTSDGLDLNIYKEVVDKLASSINIEPSLIRPSDKLTEIFSCDSWELGYGQEKFESWLLLRVGNAPEFYDASTVGDVVRVVQSYDKSHNT